MVVKNSFRQLWRMKGHMALFLILLCVSSGMCSVGTGFWMINNRNLQNYEDSFMTIGTVEQSATAVQEIKKWDAETKNYRLTSQNVYDSYIPASVLEFEGADYLAGPEKRVSYTAYNPAFKPYEGIHTEIVVEVSPVEDALPDHPVKLKITRILSGQGLMEGSIIQFCDHYNPTPAMLYKNKTYVMSLIDTQGHESEKEFPDDQVREYQPAPLLGASQYAPDGSRMKDSIDENYFCDEVTEGFYETAPGKRWLHYIETITYTESLFPVVATNNIHLIVPFYQGDTYISSGREFSDYEYRSGAKVCLVPELFASTNGLTLGDFIRLPLLTANYHKSAGQIFYTNALRPYPLLNVKGEIYKPFEDSSYEIIGIYGGSTGLGSEYGMGFNEVIVPINSIKNSDADNIVDYGSMTGSTTSFQIANGTIQEYMEKWEKQGVKNVEITFFDRGYTKLSAGIENMNTIARILAVIGAVMVLLVLGYFNWLFILRQNGRTAVERSIGFTKKQCFFSLFSGIFLILFLGSLAGCTAGAVLSSHLSASIKETVYYDTTFGNSAPVETDAESALEKENFYPVQTAAGTMGAVLLAGSLTAVIGIACNLAKEPMEMLGGKR